MGINICWEDEDKSIILMTYERPWTWNDFYAAYAEMDVMLQDVTSAVYIVIDIRKGGFPPSGASYHFKRVTQNRHPHVMKVVFVGLPLVIRSFLSVVSTAYRGKEKFETSLFMFAGTVEEAKAVLARQRMKPEIS